MGFVTGGFNGIEEAKANAPILAKKVLINLSETILE